MSVVNGKQLFDITTSMRPRAIVGLRKRDLLSYLAHIDEVTASDIARAFGVRYAVAAMGLLRLVRQGLATRERAGARGAYRYRLSQRGRSRLTYQQERNS